MNSAVFSLLILVHSIGTKKKPLDGKTKVKQKCCKVSVIGKKIFFTISKTCG